MRHAMPLVAAAFLKKIQRQYALIVDGKVHSLITLAHQILSKDCVPMLGVKIE